MVFEDYLQTMFFRMNEYETPLIEAILNDDLETVKKLKDFKDHVLAENSLGFNAIEIAKYLDKKSILGVLSPDLKRTIKVIPKGEKTPILMSEEDLKNFFNFRYLNNLISGSYDLLKQVIASANPLFRKGEAIEEKVTSKLLAQYKDKPEEFTLLNRYYSKELTYGSTADVCIEWVNETVGYGLFATEDLDIDIYIGEYTGELRRKAFWLLTSSYAVKYPNAAFKKFYVDAQKLGNETRFVNHSFHPNLKLVATNEKGLIHCILLTNRKIKKGEQLLWNYGEDFWSSRDPPEELSSQYKL